MVRTISEIEAQRRIGEILRQVAETGEPVTVEWEGKPRVIVVPAEANVILPQSADAFSHADWEARADHVRELIRQELGDQPFPDVAEQIRAMREERDDQLLADVGDNLR